MILTHNVTVTEDTVAVYVVPFSKQAVELLMRNSVWQSSADAVSMAERDRTFIHQPSDYFYLDCGGGNWDGADPKGKSWCGAYRGD